MAALSCGRHLEEGQAVNAEVDWFRATIGEADAVDLAAVRAPLNDLSNWHLHNMSCLCLC